MIVQIFVAEELRTDKFYSTTRLFFEDFKRKSRLEEIQVNGKSFSAVIVDNKNSEIQVSKKLLLDYTDQIKVGDTFRAKNANWLVIMEEEILENAYSDFLIVKCNYNVNWVDSNGVIVTTPCYVKGSAGKLVSQAYSSLKSEKIEDLSEQLAIILPSKYDLKSKTDIVLNGIGWTVSNVDSISAEGLTYATLEERKLKSTDDIDKQLGGIDKINRVKLVPAFSNPFSLLINIPTEVKFLTYKDNTLLKEIVDVEIISLEKDKNLKIEGNIITAFAAKEYKLRAYLKGTEVYTDFTIDAGSSNELNYTILGNDYIRWGAIAEYQLLKTEGNDYSIIEAIFQLEDTKSAEIIDSNNFKVVLKGLRDGREEKTIILKALLGNTVVAEKAIKIKSVMA